MVRVAGVDLPSNKRIDIALRYIYGIGPTLANEIVLKAGIDSSKRVKDLSESEVSKINNVIAQEGYEIEGDLRRRVQQNIQRLIDISSYRGIRHRRNLPTRGQRTRTNARTRRGKRKTVGSARPGEARAAKKEKE